MTEQFRLVVCTHPDRFNYITFEDCCKYFYVVDTYVHQLGFYDFYLFQNNYCIDQVTEFPICTTFQRKLYEYSAEKEKVSLRWYRNKKLHNDTQVFDKTLPAEIDCVRSSVRTTIRSWDSQGNLLRKHIALH